MQELLRHCEEIKTYVLENKFVLLCAACMAVLRIVLAAHIPILPNMDQWYDDLLLFRYTRTLLRHEWLGAYNQMTLAKNIGYSVFLMLPTLTGISYQVLLCGLHVIGCALFVVAIHSLVRRKWMRLAIFVAMLWMPPLLTWDMFQRMYRFGIVIPFVELLFSAYIAIYLRRNQPVYVLVPWVAVAGFSLAWLSFIKEDGIWVVPFVAVVSCILVGGWVRSLRSNTSSLRTFVARVGLLVVPVLCVLVVWLNICERNYRSYGIWTTCERTSTGFERFESCLVMIDAGDSNLDVWVTKDALRMALDNSPTLASISEYVWSAYDWWETEASVRGDLIFWACRNAYQDSGGYRDGCTTDAFWTQVAEELDEAFDSGRLAKKQGLRLSSTMPPLTAHDVPRFAKECLSVARMLLSLSRTEVRWGTGAGAMEDQLEAARIIGGPCRLAGENEPEGAQRMALQASEYVLAVERFLAWPMMVVCLVAFSVLTYGAVRYGSSSARNTLLIFLGLSLSCVVIIAGVSWDVLYLQDIRQWAEYIYCGACYPLFSMAGAVCVGSSLDVAAERLLKR